MSRPDLAQAKKPPVYLFKDGDILEKLKLRPIRFLAKGNTAKVFLATKDTSPYQKFAVKTFSLSCEERERSLCYFTREVQIMQAVQHKRLVPCILSAQDNTYAAIAMPHYCEDDLSSQGRVEPKRAQRFISYVAEAVYYLHKHNIAHNDIKRKNIFLDAYDRTYLGDFGLALKITDESKTVEVSYLGGTKGYLAPERVDAVHETDLVDPFKGDVYALGVTYWSLVSGDKPHEDVDYLERLRIVSDLDLSDSQRSLMERLLAPSPEHRPTASEVVKMLKRKE